MSLRSMVQEKLGGIDSVSVKKGVVKIRKGFFYRMDGSAEKLAEKVKAAFPNAEILNSGEVWKDFKGGASVANSSHWWVEFKFLEEVV